MISIGYVRFPALEGVDGPPIVYLAGGPGGSGTGTARGRRFDLFMQMRAHGDVIAFDQRGTGLSGNDLPTCRSSVFISETQRFSDARQADAYRQAIAECGDFWRAAGVDVLGYTTRESAHDLEALRVHLGADRISLWSISYGSHLAMAALNTMAERIDRVVITGAEGLDQTVKLPARTDAYFGRIQDAVDAQPAARAAYPDIAGLMRRVHARLEAEPILLEIPQPDGSTRPYLLQRQHAQRAASSLIADPENVGMLLAFYASLDAGDTSIASALVQHFHRFGEPITLRAMSTAMDMASGISPGRLAQFQAQAPNGLVGGYLNYPMPQALGVWPDIDLGDEFRTGPTGDTPILLLSGTLDGRTYPESQAEALSGMENVTIVTVRNAGHNLFMESDEVHLAIHRFMRGEPVGMDEILVEAPDFMDLPF